MRNSEEKAGKRRRYLSWSLLLSLAVYFLSLCTLSPRVHADTLRRAAQARHPSAGHCSVPSAAPRTAAPLTASHEGTTGPLCCDLRGLHNRATSDSATQTALAPVSLCSLLLPDTVRRKGRPVPIIQERHYAHPPPLYLVHGAFLI
jgi:hypothetical protein